MHLAHVLPESNEWHSFLTCLNLAVHLPGGLGESHLPLWLPKGPSMLPPPPPQLETQC